ncbi:MAG TPA: hypothetical protein HA362_06720 [Nanoarchaeota archaeon]|nr:hypothetical protein [Nanoarchaeota archaeon]
MKRINAMLVIIILILLTMGTTLLIYDILATMDIKDIGMDLRVGGSLGFNADTDKMWFGMTNPGGSSARRIIVTNDFDFPITVRLMPIGELKGYTSISENNVLLQPDEGREISISILVPAGMPYGNYTGIMRVISKKARIKG